MRFGVVELSLGMVVRTFRNWDKARDWIESQSPSRWDNPVLVVLPENWRAPREEGEVPSEYVEENVVAVPQSGWGYGAEYAQFVNRNRRRFGLSRTFIPSGGSLRVMRDRMGISRPTSMREVVEPFLGEKGRERLVEKILEGEPLEELEELQVGEEEPSEILREPKGSLDLIKLSKKKMRHRELSREPTKEWQEGRMSYEDWEEKMAEIAIQVEEEFGE